MTNWELLEARGGGGGGGGQIFKLPVSDNPGMVCDRPEAIGYKLGATNQTNRGRFVTEDWRHIVTNWEQLTGCDKI